MHEIQRITGYTYFDFFVFQGIQYPVNSVVKIKPNIYVHKNQIGLLSKYPMIQIVASYLATDGVHRWQYAIWIRDGNVFSYHTNKSPDEMIYSVLSVPDNTHATKVKAEYYKDREVKGMGIGWFIYIAAMLFGIVFKDALFIWVSASIMFFTWRACKLKKPNKTFYGINAYEKVREWNDKR